MVNCNPETVSTDYDTSDRLYFEPLTLEDVLEIVHAEQQAGPVAGVICQLGGQTPLGLAQGLADAGVPIVGTTPEAIHLAEERGAFGRVLARRRTCRRPSTAWRRRTPRRRRSRPRSATRCWCGRRTSSAGGAWRSSTTTTRCRATSAGPPQISPEHPVLVDRFIDDAVEIDVDALYDGERALPRRRHGAHRGGRHPLRRLVVRAAADHARRDRDPADPRGHRGDRQGCRGPRADQHPVRAGLRRALRPGGQPARLPHGAVRLQGDGHAAGQGGRPGDDGRVDRLAARGGGACPRRRRGRPARRRRRSRSRRR